MGDAMAEKFKWKRYPENKPPKGRKCLVFQRDSKYEWYAVDWCVYDEKGDWLLCYDEYVVAYAEFELFEGRQGVGLKWAFPDTECPPRPLDQAEQKSEIAPKAVHPVAPQLAFDF